MQHSPSWKANSYSASQEIPQILWNLKVYYCGHNSPSLVSDKSSQHSPILYLEALFEYHPPIYP